MKKIVTITFIVLLTGCDSEGIKGTTDTSTDSAPDPDAVSDTRLDTFHELTPGCPSITAEHGGYCNIVEQCGCPEGSWCDWYIDSSTCYAYETCVTGSRGSLEPGQECMADRECPAGMMCVDVCIEWCATDDDCSSSGSECRIPWSYSLLSDVCEETMRRYPYDLCSP